MTSKPYAVPLVEVVVPEPGAQLLDDVWRQRRLGSRDVHLDLAGVARAGDGRRNRLIRQNESQRGLREIARRAADDRLYLIDPLDGLLKSSWRQEVLAHVIGREDGIDSEFAAEKSRCQRDTGDDSVPLLLCQRKENLRRHLIQYVVEHLQRVRPAALHDLHPFFGRRDRDAPETNLAGILQALHGVLDFFLP